MNDTKKIKMKKTILLLIAVVAMASCSKDYDGLGYVDADSIENQGTTDVIVGMVSYRPGERVIVPHEAEYTIVCGPGCKVNINGGIFYTSGTYQNDLKIKHKFD